MINFKLLLHSPNSVVSEVSALVTHPNPLESKSSDHLLNLEVCCCLCATIFSIALYTSPSVLLVPPILHISIVGFLLVLHQT
jgi:hypothetical protein